MQWRVYAITLLKSIKMKLNKKTLEELLQAQEHHELWIEGFIEGAEWQAQRMYTEEDLRQAYNYGMFAVTTGRNFKDWFTNYKSK